MSQRLRRAPVVCYSTHLFRVNAAAPSEALTQACVVWFTVNCSLIDCAYGRHGFDHAPLHRQCKLDNKYYYVWHGHSLVVGAPRRGSERYVRLSDRI